MGRYFEELIKMAEEHERRGLQKARRIRLNDHDMISDELNRDCRASRQAADHFTIAAGLRAMAVRSEAERVSETQRHSSYTGSGIQSEDRFGNLVESQYDR